MGERQIFYAVTHDILGDPFWEVFRHGLYDASALTGCEVEHLRPGSFSPEKMIELIEAAIDARPVGLLSTIPDVATVDAPLRRAVDARIPLIAINTPDSRPKTERIPYLFYIGGDDELGGRIAAERILRERTPQSALCVDHYEIDHVCHRARYEGFAATMTAAGIPCDRLHVPGSRPDQALATIQMQLGQKHPPDALLTLGPPGCDAVVGALSALAKDDQRPLHITFDLAPAQLEAIRSGFALGTIDSQQYLQGYLGILHLHLYVEHGFLLASDILTGPSVVDRHNLADVEERARQHIR